jgi:hypothetical protein
MSNHNPFLDCEAYVSEYGTGWGVRSKYFNVPAQNEAVAKRIAELIQLSYHAGREELQAEIKQTLGI